MYIAANGKQNTWYTGQLELTPVHNPTSNSNYDTSFFAAHLAFPQWAEIKAQT